MYMEILRQKLRKTLNACFLICRLRDGIFLAGETKAFSKKGEDFRVPLFTAMAGFPVHKEAAMGLFTLK